MLKPDTIAISPQERLLNSLSENLTALLKNLILLSVDLKKFDFNFFRDEPTKINSDLLNAITFNYPNYKTAIESANKISSLNPENLADMDKLAIYLFLRFYETKRNNNYEKDILKSLSTTNDSNIINIYTGKNKLTNAEREKIKNLATLRELLDLFFKD